MALRDWRIRRGDKGWFTYHWVHRVGANYAKVSSYPIPSYWWAVPLYPWMVYQSIKAIRQVRAAHWEVPQWQQ